MMSQKVKNYWRLKAENLSLQRKKPGTLFDSKARRKVASLQRKWVRSTLKPSVGKSPERKDRFEDPSGISLRTVYTPLDVVHHEYEKEAGLPGEFPYHAESIQLCTGAAFGRCGCSLATERLSKLIRG